MAYMQCNNRIVKGLCCVAQKIIGGTFQFPIQELETIS
jgi:hypothetical protein